MPKTALIDIETSPILGYTWGLYEQNVLSVVRPVKIICGAWKWLGEDKVHVKALPDYKGYKKGVVDDTLLVRDLWSVLDAADIVVAHNGDSFDIKICNTRFVSNGLHAPSDYVTVDTLKVAKKHFRFDGNKLDMLGQALSEGRKASAGGFDTWLKCTEEGDKTAWDRMRSYNQQDIELLERIYLRLRPFMKNHPNLNVITPVKTEGHACTVCQSTNTQKRGFLITRMGRYQRYACQDCGAWSSGPYERVDRA